MADYCRCSIENCSKPYICLHHFLVSPLSTEKRTRPAKDPKPIMFTRPVETESHRLLPQNTRASPDDDRRGVRKPFKLLNEISAASSFSSLMEGWT